MAIVNCNEDSFYEPSRALGEKAVEMALLAEREGAAIIDFGGESSRPGSSGIGVDEELQRVIPVINAFRKVSKLPVSLDTRKSLVARAALDSGADIINDISGLEDDPDMAAVCAKYGAAVVIMHKKGDPLTMQDNPRYGNLIEEIKSWLLSAAKRATAAGISPQKIILDPGMGFGKNLDDNLEILRRLASFTRLAETHLKGYPLMVGLSRKSFLGEITGRSQAERLSGTLAANAAAILNGADIIRVHDVKEHSDLIKILFSLRSE